MSMSSDSGGPGLRDSEAAAAFNQGKGRVLGAMIVGLLAFLGGLTWYLTQEQAGPYSELGKQVNGLRTQYFDGFMVCALPGKRIDQIKSDADLRSELHVRGTAGARFGAHLRSKCSTSLRELSTRLRALLPPSPAAPLVSAMADGATKMTAGVEAYAAHLDALADAYDQAAAEPEIEPLVRGWYEFRKAHAELNRLVKEKLGR